MGIDPDVMKMVRKQLDRDPPPPTTALYGRAARINSDIYKLTLRQFHAKYPLRVKRERARAARDGSRGGAPGNGAPAPEEGRSDASHETSTRDDGGDGKGVASAGPRDVRAGIREVLMEVAREAARARGPTGGVEVVAAVEKHVDRLVRLLAGADGADASGGGAGPPARDGS